jgi:hypothetical protein
MTEIQTSTLRYFYLAITRYLPDLIALKEKVGSKEKEQLEEWIEIYEDVSKKIRRLGLSHGDPNTILKGESWEFEIEIPTNVIENLCMLTHKMLLDWQARITKLKSKNYRTESDKKELKQLVGLEWPLRAQLGNMSSFLGMYAEKGPLQFPDAKEPAATPVHQSPGDGVFPDSLLQELPTDVAALCREFNFNFENQKPNASMLLLRRILPLAIVRKFQIEKKEQEIKNPNGEFLDTQALLGKTESRSAEKRIFKDINNYKPLVDSSQHSYSLNVHLTDVKGAAVQIRLLLDELF